MARTIEVSTTLQVTRELAIEVLRSQAVRVVSGGTETIGANRVYADLSIDLHSGGVHQAVEVALDGLREAEGEVWVPIRWHPVGRERLLPAFSGVVELREEEGRTILAINGQYDAPLGPVGRFGDAVLGRRVAQQSLSALVADMARRIDELAATSHPTEGWRPAVYPVSLRDADAPLLG